MAKMTMKQYEKTAIDKKADKAGQKKVGAGKKYEGSKADMKQDKANLKKINAKRK
jgi:hypothetical protein